MRHLTAAAIIALAAATGPAHAQSLEYWGAAGGWDVMVDPTLGNGCLIQAQYQDGSVVRIGFDLNAGSAYVTAFNEAWGDIDEGETYNISFALDDELYEGTARGIYLNDVPGADIYFENFEFLWDIAKRYTMTLFHEDRRVMAIDLEGSMVGLNAMAECQDGMS